MQIVFGLIKMRDCILNKDEWNEIYRKLDKRTNRVCEVV